MAKRWEKTPFRKEDIGVGKVMRTAEKEDEEKF